MSEQTEKKATQYEDVNMDNGDVVRFAGKRRMVKSSDISKDGFTVTVSMHFRNGESRQFAIEANAPLFAKFAAHGIEQKFGDEIAGLDDVEDAIIAIDELIDRLDSGRGEWGVKREVSGLAGASVLHKALVRHSGKSAEAVKQYLASKSAAEKMALRKNAAIAPIIAELEANKKKKEPKPVMDTEDLLGELTA